ncbi:MULTISPECIES: flagellar basal body-associated protein FliL [Cytobacillus]|jgi:flagellar protein FliL|uniref:Flagellar protein FliL n=3 Tax=Cytobacillus TaxID=2675230 RepID=A0A160M9K4_9BACI|nr:MULTISPECIES: flagellar basal body-associated protein FliL [Cytobacillus]MBY0157398.1 flagellar basal body-associated protein FliL [Cytobacillus firmus]AND39399.1 flagellar basal body-associated protein FliL [Cytobacillus oceanisediminis 2691]MBU8729298.1 flagellar basal body-associated protein FliL [Cytobacillus oceanisediminis]MBU8768587.1 flagellar basal body-associated protein FliL [Cytobacillus oceanisediminis]MCM3242836.1 flagellar basal body-associated protein FliL [Cytobacillus ocea
MKNNKLLMIMLMMLVAITLVGAIALVIVMKFSGEDETKEPTIDDVLEASVDIPQITANLASDDYIRISFKIQTENKKAKEELQKRDFQVKNLIIQELSEMKAEDIQGKEGQIKLQEDLKTKINGLMQEGKIVQVYITESLLQ